MHRSLIGRRITVMGLGSHGGGISAVRWLAKHGAILTVTDLRPKSALRSALRHLPRRSVHYVLGEHRRQDFETADIILQNPAVSNTSRFLRLAKKAGVTISNDATLFFQHCPSPIIGVTGSKGKTTTAAIIANILQAAGRHPHLVGVEGMPVLEALDTIQQKEPVVFELSSWRLERLSEHHLSPTIGILTNVYGDHLDRYPSYAAYAQAKETIFRFQRPNDVAVVSLDSPRARRIGERVKSQRYWFSLTPFQKGNGAFLSPNGSLVFRRGTHEENIINRKDLHLLGEHNIANVLAAIISCRLLRVPTRIIQSSLRNFSGVPHRLEIIRRFHGVTYVNDTIATIPDATIAAIRSMTGPLILIAGGMDKALHYRILSRLIAQRVKHTILLPGSASRILELLLREKKAPMSQAKTMSKAVHIAQHLALTGDTVLLSPAATSFASFRDAFDRGKAFRRSVRTLR